jgi:hypothetical protein
MGSFSAPSSGLPESRRLAVESTVRWLPLADPYYLLASVLVTARSAPLVVEQRALLEVEANCRAAEPKPYGILLGGHYFCPRGRFEYLLVQQAIGLLPEPEELDPMAAMAAQLSAYIRDAEHRGHRVVGWYRDGAEILPRVGAREARLHRMLCPEPWHVALLRNASGVSPSGAFVRLEPTEIRPYSIPFHELLPEGKQRSAQQRRTCVRWSNYRSDGEVELLP